jgi:molybdate/tungstate transport system substrate-binding protein
VHTSGSRRRSAAALFAAAALLAACGSSGRKAAPSAAHGSGPVDVLYAGSLVGLMDKAVDPGFHSATGYSVSGVAGDSGSLANEIKGGTQQGDVFLSASPAKDQLLEGTDNGGWVDWYAAFATSNLVLGYNPSSRFAAALRTQPWYRVITEPGFLLGRTDPATDPKGKLTVKALEAAAALDPAAGAALRAVTGSTADVFPEATLVGRLQSGQLDAGFFYAVEASSAGLPTVALSGVPVQSAGYTVTVLRGAPHEAAALAFVAFLLGPAGSADLESAGLTVTRPPAVVGTPPAALQAVLSGR